MSLTPGELAAFLGALNVRLESVEATRSVVRLPDYPGGRPTASLRLQGAGHDGDGECVAWDDKEQEAFVSTSAQVNPGTWTVTELAAYLTPAYWRSAWEGALIDLALKQAGRSLASIAGAPAQAEVRYVVSFAATSDPVGEIQQCRQIFGPDACFKIDVDPEWGLPILESLAQNAPSILDFKAQANPHPPDLWRAHFPKSIFEDFPGTLQGPRAHDKEILTAGDIAVPDTDMQGPLHINIKAPRMGGYLEALRAMQRCLDLGLPFYMGGMFEVGAGRRQARKLAALYAAQATNDLAPLRCEDKLWAKGQASPSPLRIDLNEPGF